MNYGDWAGLKLMDEIHEKTGHYPGLIGVDYAGKGGIVIGPPNKAGNRVLAQGWIGYGKYAFI